MKGKHMMSGMPMKNMPKDIDSKMMDKKKKNKKGGKK